MAAPSADTVKAEIARELVRLHEESYGEGAAKVEVALDDCFVTVILDVELNRAERTLVESGHAKSVQIARESFQEAIAATFTAIIERATGRRVVSFASRTIVGEHSWSVEVFRLATPANWE